MLPSDLVRLGLSRVIGLDKCITGGFGKSGLSGDESQDGVGEESM